MLHGTLTVITKIRPEAVGDVRVSLRRLDSAIEARAPHPFREINELYFAHWAISGSAPWNGQPGPPHDCYLVFGADLRLSGSFGRQRQLREAVTLLVDRLVAHRQRTGDTTFDALYSRCEGYPPEGLASPARVRAFLLEHAVAYNARHIDFAYRVATTQGIRRLAELRAEVEGYLNDGHRRPFLERLGAVSIHGALRKYLGATLSRVSGPRWTRSVARARLEAAAATLSYLPLDKLLPWFVRLKSRFQKKRRTVERVSVPDALREEIEARQGPVQNSMILISDVPTRRLARLRQRLFLRIVNWRLKRNLVGMNDIRAIHFARWAIFRRGPKRQLLFIVTYDESWEAYIDSFVDHEDVSTFLKLIWGGTTGFPRGVPFVEPFKEWIRSVQCPTLARYSAFLHGQAQPRLLAVTDLHEMLDLQRVLSRPSLHAPERVTELRMLEAFLRHGRFPYQEKLLSPRQSASLLGERLLSPLRPMLTPRPRIRHAATRTMEEIRTRALAVPPSVPHPSRWRRPVAGTSLAPGTGRHAGAPHVRVQAHGGRLLPAAEDRGGLPVPGVAAGDPERRPHDRG